MGKPSHWSDERWEEFCRDLHRRQAAVMQAELEFAQTQATDAGIITPGQARELEDWFRL